MNSCYYIEKMLVFNFSVDTTCIVYIVLVGKILLFIVNIFTIILINL